MTAQYPQHRVVTNGYRFAVQQKWSEKSDWYWFRGFCFSVPSFTISAENADLFLWKHSAKSALRAVNRYYLNDQIEKARHAKEWIEVP